jgi:hypothetical protein
MMHVAMSQSTHVHHGHLIQDATGRHLASDGSGASADCGVQHLLAALGGELLADEFGRLNLFAFV